LKKLALFDLDNTLLDGDSDYEWAQFLIEEGVLHADEYNAKNDWFYERYKDGTLDIHEFLDFQLKPIARRPRAQLDAWHSQFMQRRIRPIILPKAPELLARHGDALTAIVTATNRFITQPIASELGYRTCSPPTSRRDPTASSPASRAARPRSARARSGGCATGSASAAPGSRTTRAGSTAIP